MVKELEAYKYCRSVTAKVMSSVWAYIWKLTIG